MMPVSNVAEAARVLSAAQHRGARLWYFDGGLLRVLPAEWNGLGELPPAFTVFEAVCIARRLAQIGAVQPLDGAGGGLRLPG